MPDPRATRPLVLTGMHRSGTSLVARLFREAGVDLGGELVPADAYNVRGHFEDRDFQAFHERVLRSRAPKKRALWLPPDDLRWSPEEREAALELIRTRAGPAAWGWKDPRTVLFLDAWRELLPEAVFLLLFRHPEQVVDSLRRRRDRGLVVRVLGRSLSWDGRRRGPFRTGRAIEAWRRYNERILRFATAHPEQTVCVELETLLRDPAPIATRVASKLGVSLRPVAWADVFEPGLLTRRAHARVSKALAKRPEVLALHAQLRACASKSTSQAGAMDDPAIAQRP